MPNEMQLIFRLPFSNVKKKSQQRTNEIKKYFGWVIWWVCVYIPDAQLSADEIFDKDSFSESIIYALPSGL